MNTGKRIKLAWTALLILLCTTTHVHAQAISLYGGLSFPASPLKSNAEQELAQPLVIRIVGTNEKGELVPAKDSGVPVREDFDPKTGQFKSELWTHAANVTWQFTKAGIEFAADGISYLVNKEGASIRFTKAAVEMEGITKVSASPVAKKERTEKRPNEVRPAEICSLPEGVPIALTRLDAGHIGYGSSVPIPAIGAFFEKFYSIDLATNQSKRIEREEFYTKRSADQKALIVWEESFGFTYVKDGNNLKQVEFSKSNIKYRKVPANWVEIASYTNKVEAVVLSPDGTSVLVAIDGKIHSLKPSGESRVLLSLEGTYYKDPAFGATSDRFYVESVAAKAGYRAVVVCNVESGKTSTVVSAPNLQGFTVSPDGNFLAYLEGSSPIKRIRILSVADKKLVREIEHEKSNVASNPLLIFSDDSSMLYFGKYGGKGEALFRMNVK